MAEEQKAQADTYENATIEDVVEETAAEAAPEAGTDTAALEQALAAKDEEIQALKDQALRAAAEAQNARRRAEQDIEKAHKFALEKFTNELLPVVDSLERALEAAGESDDDATKALREGVEMTLTMFTNGLAKFQIEQVNPVGETFDPELHQAMSMVDGGDAPSNSVIAVMQKGYTLHGRLVRPAMVMVAK